MLKYRKWSKSKIDNYYDKQHSNRRAVVMLRIMWYILKDKYYLVVEVASSILKTIINASCVPLGKVSSKSQGPINLHHSFNIYIFCKYSSK